MVEDLSTLAHHVVGLVLLITESWSRVFGSGKESVIKLRRSGTAAELIDRSRSWALVTCSACSFFPL